MFKEVEANETKVVVYHVESGNWPAAATFWLQFRKRESSFLPQLEATCNNDAASKLPGVN